jgi:hypothetical protein
MAPFGSLRTMTMRMLWRRATRTTTIVLMKNYIEDVGRMKEATVGARLLGWAVLVVLVRLRV